ncbi:MAG: transcription antitermination factor NusB [Dehalococcoidia bacterium]|nr:transcription antitermination factor NusB [Dehalococcoidia bacterium]
MAGLRRKGRALALQALYEIDSVGHGPDDVLSRLAAEQETPEEAVAFARGLVNGVLTNLDRIDHVISRYAPAFPVEQLAVIDRNILRLAIFEVLLDNKVPMKAAINEAVDLAKAFGSDSSPKFINGVLGSVAAEVLR